MYAFQKKTRALLYAVVLNICYHCLPIYASFLQSDEPNFSLQVTKKYLADDEPAMRALEIFKNATFCPQEVVKERILDPLKPSLILGAPFMRKAESIVLYHKILIDEPKGYHSYHGYDALSALIYDVYTGIAEHFRTNAVQPRSRFRFHSQKPPYTSISLFLMREKFVNDHEPNFTNYGISATPHLFSNTASDYMAENCLTAFHEQLIQTDSKRVQSLLLSIGFKEPQKYLDLALKHLKGGFLTRFTFHSSEALNEGTYPAPNASSTGAYGKPWQSSSGSRISSSMLFEELSALDNCKPFEKKNFLFNMQYRNIYIPRIYNNPEYVTTKIFSLKELPTLQEYTERLKGYIQEDIQSLSNTQQEQVALWLQ